MGIRVREPEQPGKKRLFGIGPHTERNKKKNPKEFGIGPSIKKYSRNPKRKGAF